MTATAARKKTTTQKGLGWQHQQASDGLFRHHTDGKPCDWCGRSMYRDRTKNYDYNPDSTNPHSGKLQADHSKITRAEAVRRGIPIPKPDRLLHGDCNRERGDGKNDHLAAAGRTTGPDPTTPDLLMPWPWT